MTDGLKLYRFHVLFSNVTEEEPNLSVPLTYVVAHCSSIGRKKDVCFGRLPAIAIPPTTHSVLESDT